MPRLMTDWLCVGVSGKTVDGRDIDPQWLIDAAETYSLQRYTALIWPRHHDSIEERSWSYNYGEVAALKYEQDGDTVKLYARLMPNDWLIDTNRMGQKLFTSVEVLPNFAGSGRWYLTGLSVTDQPASTGTDRLAFSVQAGKVPVQQGSVEAFTLGHLSDMEATPEAGHKTDLTLLQRVFSRLVGKDDEENMTKEQFEQLMAGQKAQTEAMSALVEGLKQFSMQGQPAADAPEKAAEKPAAGDAEKPAVTAEQFSQLEASQKGMGEKLDQLLQAFTQMATTPATVTPDMNPGDSENKTWL